MRCYVLLEDFNFRSGQTEGTLETPVGSFRAFRTGLEQV
jgi:hypothetical protein